MLRSRDTWYLDLPEDEEEEELDAEDIAYLKARASGWED